MNLSARVHCDWKELCVRASAENKYLSFDTLLDYGWKWAAQQEKNAYLSSKANR